MFVALSCFLILSYLFERFACSVLYPVVVLMWAFYMRVFDWLMQFACTQCSASLFGRGGMELCTDRIFGILILKCFYGRFCLFCAFWVLCLVVGCFFCLV